MTTQPDALRLADKMSSYSLSSGYAWHCHKAAAELRRLHEVNAELLEALKAIVNSAAANQAAILHPLLDDAHEAISKAEGELK